MGGAHGCLQRALSWGEIRLRVQQHAHMALERNSLRTIVQCQPYQSEGTPLLVDREEDFYPGLISLRVMMRK